MFGTADVATIFNPPAEASLQYAQGQVVSWEPGTGHNKIQWFGGTLTDVSVLADINALTIQAEDLVGMLGWTSPGGISTWWVVGRIVAPGAEAGNLTLRGGGIILEGGQLRLNDRNGISVFYMGDVASGDEVSRGWIARFDTGALAFALGGPSGQQTWGLRDREEQLLVANDVASSTGLARPFLNIPLYPSSGTSVGTGGPFWPQFTNGSYQEVMHGITTLWHPRIRVGVATNAPSGTVEWELRIDGVTIGSGSGTGFGTFDVTGWGSTIMPGDQVSVQLWCRNTAGVASRVIPDYCYGLES